MKKLNLSPVLWAILATITTGIGCSIFANMGTTTLTETTTKDFMLLFLCSSLFLIGGGFFFYVSYIFEKIRREIDEKKKNFETNILIEIFNPQTNKYSLIQSYSEIGLTKDNINEVSQVNLVKNVGLTPTIFKKIEEFVIKDVTKNYSTQVYLNIVGGTICLIIAIIILVYPLIT